MSPDVYHPVFNLLKDGVLAWCKGEEYKPDISEFPRKMQECIESALHDQEAIGWQNAIKGCMSVEWRTLADMSPYGNDHASPQGSGLSSLLHILRQFHRLASRQWRSRNQVLHGTNETSLQDIRDSELAEIRHIYAQPNQLTVADRHYC